MAFKVLDVERSPTSQGFKAHSYDVIVASNVLHATASMERTLRNTRQLLKPGGWLVLAELTEKDSIRFNEIMGGLAGWWLGVDDGRTLGPTLTPREWHAVLRATGFGGVDAMTPKMDAYATWPFSIIAAQAVDDRITMLRRPLSSKPSPSLSPIYHESVVILGTKSLQSASIAEQLVEHLSPFSDRVIVLDGLPTEDEAQRLSPMSTFINLVDLDDPIFKGMTKSRMEALKRVFELARHVLWVTNGAMSADNPYHLASVAFRRVMSNEERHIGFYHLDLVALSVDNYVSKEIAEHLLRQAALDEWERETPLSGASKIRRYPFLWSSEPEAFRDASGRLLIPRLKHDDARNDRLNSSRRLVTQTRPAADLGNIRLSLHVGSPPTLIEQNLPAEKPTANRVQAEGSIMMALRIEGDEFLFLGVGRTIEDDVVFYLSTTNAYMTTPVASVAPPAMSADPVAMLIAVASEILAASIVEGLSPGNSIVVQSVSPRQSQSLGAALIKQAKAKDVQVTLVDSSPTSTANTNLKAKVEGARSQSYYQDKEEEGDGLQWVRLDARAPTSALRRLLPRAPTHFLSLSSFEGSDSTDASTILARLLPPGTRYVAASDLARLEARGAHAGDLRDAITARLQDAVASAASTPSPSTVPDGLVLSLDQIHENTKRSWTSALRWSSLRSDDVQVEVNPLDARRLFAADKSYLLVGLTGEMGQSVCEWMARNGAGHVCLASRTPKANKEWLRTFEGTGTTVKTYALDLVDKANLAEVVADIRATCPPIAGVFNGAMVLIDSLFSKLSVDNMQAVLAPKIDGSKNLDEIFYNDFLDFFVLFSSSTTLMGNPGQSSYVVANGYMNGLARQRRKRGLAASTVDIGRVAGLGYIEKAGQHVLGQLTRFGLMPVSETELHQMLAETIRAGYPSSDDLDDPNGVQFSEAIVTTGLRSIRDDEDLRGPWFENPLFSHFIFEAGRPDGSTSGGQLRNGKQNTLPIRQQLAAATQADQALGLLCESFTAKLSSILQIPSQKLEQAVPLVELGMDSLVAVEARSWFLEELKTDIPVLKLVGGSSVLEICQLALKKLPEGSFSTPESGEAKGTQQVSTSAKPAPSNSSPRSLPSDTDIDDGSAGAPMADTPQTTITQTSLDALHEQTTKSTHLSKTSEAASKTFVKSAPISFGQSRFWFLRLLIQDPTTFNVTLNYRLSGRIRVGDLDRALRAVAARHESLRTCFVGDENEVDKAYQKILARSLVSLEHMTVRSTEDALAEYDKLRLHEFDLASGPLLRMVLLTLSPTSHYLLVNAHHIIMDVTSFQILLSDMEKVYNHQPLGPRPRQYAEFSMSQRQALEQGQLDDELKYWRRIFPADNPAPILPLLPVARSSSRTAEVNFDVHEMDTKLEPALVARIKSVAKAKRCTPFHFYLAAFKAMLFSLTSTEDLTIGIADANRNDSGLIRSIGFFMNLLALRFHRQTDQSFADSVSEARNTAHAALEHSRLPFDVLLQELQVARSSSNSPMFQAFFDYRQRNRGGQVWAGCQFDLESFHPGRIGYDIALDVADINPEANVVIRVQKCFYDMTAASLLLETYTHLLDIFSRDPSLSWQEAPLFSGEQLARAVKIGRGKPYSKTVQIYD